MTRAHRVAVPRSFRSLAWLLPLCLLLSAGCNTIKVRTDWDHSLEFDGMRRYHWVEPPPVPGASPFADNTLLRKRLRQAIEMKLADRGYRFVDSREAADFLVTYSVVLEERVRVDGVSTGGGYVGPRYAGFGTVYSSGSVRNYQESTLIIDFLDPATDDLVWRGWGSGVLSTRDRDRGQQRIEDGVRQILAEFPPDPPKPSS